MHDVSVSGCFKKILLCKQGLSESTIMPTLRFVIIPVAPQVHSARDCVRHHEGVEMIAA